MPPMTSYLGPVHQLQPLGTWEQVEIAARNQLLDENQWVELKKDIPDGRSDSRETAKDLAALAVYGGTLIVGIAEVKNGQGKMAGEVVGAPTATLVDRISSIAATVVKPALMVVTHLINHPTDPALGVLVVTVPASAVGPHMVDGSYYGRSATGKRKLEDVEVRRLVLEHEGAATGFQDRLIYPSLEDGAAMNKRARFYLLVEPGTPAPTSLVQTLRAAHYTTLSSVIGTAPLEHHSASPSLTSLIHQHHSEGLAGVSDQAPVDDEDLEHLFVLLHDDGGLFLSAPASRAPRGSIASNWMPVPSVLETVHNALALVAHLAELYTGYQGSWRVGLYATHLRGVTTMTNGVVDPQPYLSQEYMRVTTTSTHELDEATYQVVDRLTRDLLRGLGDEHRLPYTNVSDLWGQRR